MNTFTLHATGELESCHSTKTRAMYATLGFFSGPDWTATEHGQLSMVTQLAYRPSLGPPPLPSSPGALLLSVLSLLFSSSPLSSAATLASAPTSCANPSVATWSYPFDWSWRSTNPYGWPQAIVSVYGPDAWNRDVLVGYALVPVPRLPGRHTVYAPLFVPRASTMFNEWLSWITGRPPELLGLAALVGKDGGHRQALRVTSDGMVKMVFNVAIKDLDKFGYQVGPSTGLGTGLGGSLSASTGG